MMNTTKSEALAIANTILDQMGGLNRLRAMVGADQALAIESGVQFAFKGCRKANKCVVRLDPSDTYTVEFWACRPVRFNARTGAMTGGAVKVSESSDVYADSLVQVFEGATGLYLHF
jgi:hypothetical protein